jgi:hypothetical protein
MILSRKIVPSLLSTEQSLPAYPEAKCRGFIAGVFLSGLLISTTSFDYIWYGPIPAWLIMLFVGIFFSLLIPSHRQAIVQFLRRTWLPIILPWVLFVLIVAIIDTSKGLIDDTFSKRVNLNLATLALMVMVGAWSSRVRPAIVIYVVAFIVCMQGLICIAQYMKIVWAWDLPELIVQFSGARLEKGLLVDVDFNIVGRVRGTNPFVHKFNSMQGVGATFILLAFFLNMQANNALRLRMMPVVVAALFGGIGVILTFSRSTILGGALAMVAILINVRKFAIIFILVIVSILGYYAAQELGIQKAEQFNRITDFSTHRLTNVSRMQQYSYALKVFSEAPFLGQPEGVGNKGLLVHSVILRLLTDYGALGTLPYLAVLFGISWFLLHHRSAGGESSRVVSLAALCSVGVAVLDAWTHSSGLLVREVAQPALIGAYLGALLGQITLTARIGERASALNFPTSY